MPAAHRALADQADGNTIARRDASLGSKNSRWEDLGHHRNAGCGKATP
jgi:hypothetical protein